MKARFYPSHLLFLLMGTASLIGCAKNETAPTKEAAIARLRELKTLLDEKKYGEAIPLFLIHRENRNDSRIELEDMVSKIEMTDSGIDRLEKQGKFGSLEEVFGDDSQRFIQRFGLTDPANCFALKYEDAEAGFYWDGQQFLIFRCDDID